MAIFLLEIVVMDQILDVVLNLDLVHLMTKWFQSERQAVSGGLGPVVQN